jgi:hypothetical protein
MSNPVLDEKKQQNNYVIQNLVPDSAKRNARLIVLIFLG